MKLYILSSACVSPLDVYSQELSFSSDHKDENDCLKVVEPHYKEFLDLNIIRRVAKYTKIGLYAALKTINDFGSPDAIIVGTGVGGFLHSEKFIFEMDENSEKNLSPNFFFQSLHSSLSGNISIISKCKGYNITYVNRGTSFESTLMDAALHLKNSPSKKILIGTSDEITENYSLIVKQSKYFDTEIYKLGEGAAFMLVTGEKIDNCPFITAFETFYKTQKTELNKNIEKTLQGLNLTINEIDLLISDQNVYSEIAISDEIPVIFYKNFVGEYPTSSSFAVWLASYVLKEQRIPKVFEINEKLKFKNILVVNQFKSNFSIIVLSI